MTRVATTWPRAAAAVLMLVLAGCAGLPQEGPIHSVPSREPGADVDTVVDYTPDGPRPGAAPLDVAGGFLEAMQATPLSTAVAQEFLTDEASAGWVPERSTIVYGLYALKARGRAVRLELSDTDLLGSRGEWLGDPSGGRGIEHTLRLVRERGQWRIANPPDALIVAEAYFETRFTQHFLHFFDPAAEILVPEPVYVPVGEQAPTLLVRGLLAGPEPRLREAARTFIPTGAELDDLSVLVSAEGTAQVPLTEEMAELDEESLDRALAQIGWTLDQVPGVRSFRVTVAGSPLELPGRGTRHEVDDWPEYDPSVVWASQQMFGLRNSRVVSRTDRGTRRVGGVAGTEDFDVRAIAPDLPAERVAGVTPDGSSVLLAPLEGVGSPGDISDPVFSGAQNLLPPAWDIYGQLWLVDRRRTGAALSVVRSGEATALDVPGISGRDVEAFALARDGSRLVAVVDRGRRDQLYLTRVLRREDGSVAGFTRARGLPVGALQVGDIRDVGWHTPGSVLVLTTPSPGVSQVLNALVDGSSRPGDDAEPDAAILREPASRLMAAPSPGTPVYVQTRDGALHRLSDAGEWTRTATGAELVSPTYVG